MDAVTVTLDTNLVNRQALDEIQEAVDGLNVHIAKTTVTSREQGVRPDETDLIETGVWNESRWGNFKWGGDLPETLVLNESRLGQGVIGNSATAELYENLLRIVSNNSFPARGKRGDLTGAQRRQLRDVMILHTHTREGRDILVSNDMRAFGRPESDLRRTLEDICKTRILTSAEFVDYCNSQKSGRT